jgi:hypothetical protein
MAVCRAISKSTMIHFRKRPCSSLRLMLPRCELHVRFMKLTGMGAVAWNLLQQLCTSVSIHEVIETFIHITLHCRSLESSLNYERIGFHQSFIRWKDEKPHSVRWESAVGGELYDTVLYKQQLYCTITHISKHSRQITSCRQASTACPPCLQLSHIMVLFIYRRIILATFVYQNVGPSIFHCHSFLQEAMPACLFDVLAA